MSWINTLLFKLSAFCRCRVIDGPDRQPYLERYHVMCLPFGYQVYLHRFVASDPGRGLHNHPWQRALSLVLSGGYLETRMLGATEDNVLQTRWIGAGRFNLISGETFHRVNLPRGRECWSLFIHAPKAKTWGFIERRGYRDHDEIVSPHGNPLWWKNAPRPINCPEIRLPCAA
jgi:hypothetical protein